MSYDCAYYLDRYLDPKQAKRQIALALKVLKRRSDEFDTIAFTGLSGALIAPELAHRLGKHLIAVRKSERNNHSGRKVEGYTRCEKYLVVDDLIDSGATTLRIQRAIKKFAPKAKCIGTLEVNDISQSNVERVGFNTAYWCMLREKKK